MVGSAKRYRIFIAHPAAQCAWLHVPEVVGVRGKSSAQQTRLCRYELEVSTIAVPAWFAQGKGAFIDVPCNGIVHALLRLGDYDCRLDLWFRRNPSDRMWADLLALPLSSYVPGRRGGKQWREAIV
jgi:hypothetical protein